MPHYFRGLNWFLGILFFFVGFISSFLFFNFYIDSGIAEAPTNETLPTVAAESTISADDIVQTEIYYRACRHLETKEAEPGEFVGKSFAMLEKEGWQVYENSTGKIILSKDEEGLCPEDVVKRHIKQEGDHLAIYTGPAGVEGECLGYLYVHLEDLPATWQVSLAADGVTFFNEESLWQALESIDELEYSPIETTPLEEVE